jgi:hypothetical protein
MWKRIALGALIAVGGLLAIVAAQADKLYKWTDPEGNVHYTDHAPIPAEAKKQERKRFGDKPTDVPLPYALQRATKNFPVTLYTSDCGDACVKGAALLSQRGVPFTEKNARDTAAGDELKALTGGKLEVPVLKLGTQVVRGYEEGAWNQALDAAGYPRTAVIAPRVTAKTSAPKREPAKAEAAKPDAPKPDVIKPAEVIKPEVIKPETKPESGKDEKPAAKEEKPAAVPGPNAAQ